MQVVKTEVIEYATQVINAEIAEAQKLLGRLEDNFAQAVSHIVNCQSKIIVSGIGKSGHIGKKMAATLASTGSPAFFVHPAEALHGDLGMITKGDLVILISNSGESAEFKTMLPILKERGISIIGMTGNTSSHLAQNSDCVVNIAIDSEACPLGLAPTSSAVNTLIMGDALAITAMKIRKFDSIDFAQSHPAGALGAKLLTTVGNVISEFEHNAICQPEQSLAEAISVLCESGKGLIAICRQTTLVGVFTDGDLRRALANGAVLEDKIEQHMTTNGKQTSARVKAYDALNLMLDNAISALPVVNERDECVGVISISDIHRRGIK
ncbi:MULTISPECIES: KpsF/GutQ family sugar-phosphate isomerase [Vibrio]|uniref:Arabinose 5-phosphate isomerase n=1 Tax=Vibrio mediterranei TaxID=689 RepID=A0A3G4VIE8_9VIBR|nr:MULTISPECIES: KpsF/GutQ family sugar-phosphate isomerase [Vibrio]AYV23969.1 KpsF/GutQ family sugar-phosphate isomerase [Vibrio mediterranei]KFA95285.1 D-arabinose 5-phosphate isomerase [Vibrio sp. ER1A]MCG9658833.1 KpsF/GutQ family sugar-phosphate isomerase [Vibrio mediterranei]MCG9663272.1 KpsF/GutQ family sugar-phosphate isomerase [Vibrio mediterranei]MCG9788083.1 KpsF/GutQ family sugar-phosphate isomerase [Vibrio mediterranei]